MKPQADPTKTDLYGMLTDEQIREYLASPRTDERLRARLLREVDRRAAPGRQTIPRANVRA